MKTIFRILVVALASLGIAGAGGTAYAQGKGRDKDQKEHKEHKEKKEKKAKHQNGKQLLGDRIKKDGSHKVHENGKHTAFVEVKGGKIAGMKVKHAEKGDVPVKKYKTNKQMAGLSTTGMQPVAYVPVQMQYLGTTYIGYAYIDEWGDEVIYWYPYEMVLDGDTGAVEYYPA